MAVEDGVYKQTLGAEITRGNQLMSVPRALTNITGNGVAAVFVSWWEGELDREKLHANLDRTFDPSDVEAAVTTG